MHTIQVLVLRDNRTKRKQRVMIMIRWSAALLAGASVMPRACWHMGYVFWRKKKSVFHLEIDSKHQTQIFQKVLSSYSPNFSCALVIRLEAWRIG